jgi:hypothetical protein
LRSWRPASRTSAQDLPAVSHRERRVQQAQPRVIAVDEVESGLAAGGRQTWYPARPSLWCMNRSRRTSSPVTTIRGRIVRDMSGLQPARSV